MEYKKIRKVRAATTHELFEYISEKAPDTLLKIVTTSGQIYHVSILNIGIARGETKTGLFLLHTDKWIETNDMVHLSLSSIEAFEISGDYNVLDIFSLGTAASIPAYELSGKLEVRRAFKDFDDQIMSRYNIRLGTPEMDLPEDGILLNRLIKLTHIIQQVIINVLKADDALSSWKEKISSLSFENNTALKVTISSNKMTIQYPFFEVEEKEMEEEELSNAIMQVL